VALKEEKLAALPFGENIYASVFGFSQHLIALRSQSALAQPVPAGMRDFERGRQTIGQAVINDLQTIIHAGAFLRQSETFNTVEMLDCGMRSKARPDC